MPTIMMPPFDLVSVVVVNTRHAAIVRGMADATRAPVIGSLEAVERCARELPES